MVRSGREAGADGGGARDGGGERMHEDGTGGVEVTVTLSLCEVYNEVCSDLLQPSRLRLAIVDDPLVGVKVRVNNNFLCK